MGLEIIDQRSKTQPKIIILPPEKIMADDGNNLDPGKDITEADSKTVKVVALFDQMHLGHMYKEGDVYDVLPSQAGYLIENKIATAYDTKKKASK
jgi:hypothetical protein